MNFITTVDEAIQFLQQSKSLSVCENRYKWEVFYDEDGKERTFRFGEPGVTK